MDKDLNLSTNLNPPAYGPTWPLYPPLCELCRVTGAPFVDPSSGKKVYPALLQQFVPPLGIRDRISIYVFEPNNVQLGPGIYDARLVSNYNGLPLYATTCCPTSTSSASSASSSSSH